MSKLSIEDQFSNEMDDYLSGIDISHKSGYEEDHILLELGMNLASKDFSKDSNKEAVLKKIQKNMNVNKGDSIMKKVNRFRRIAVVAASLAIVCTVMMQTTFAQDLIVKIKNSISLGHITALQVEQHREETYPVPDKLKGKLFDKEGKLIEEFTEENQGKMYTADGEKIVDWTKEGEIITEAQKEKMDKEKYLVVKNIDELNKYTCFNVILPSYLPEGCKFDRAQFYKDENGTVSNSKYVDLYFTNELTGKYIWMQQRFADEETGYEFSTDGEIEKVKVNEVDAVICDGKSIDWEANGVLYGLFGKGEISKDELIKIAESIK